VPLVYRPGVARANHLFRYRPIKAVDGRDKPGHDGK
jgi:hypothetical protein